MTTEAVQVPPVLGRVLVVSPVKTLANFAAQALLKARHEVVADYDMMSARREIERARFDAVVVDLETETDAALELLGWVREREPATITVALTGPRAIRATIHAFRAGAADCVIKPFSPNALVLAVDRALRSHLHRAERPRAPEAQPSAQETDGIVTASTVMRYLNDFARHVADAPLPVLIGGASGVGKETMAGVIHRRSSRGAGPLVVMRCESVAGRLIEAELFGDSAGESTRKRASPRSVIHAAEGGTLVIKDIDALPLDVQARLRDMPRARAEVVGDMRVIATTRRDLRNDVAEGRFDGGLYRQLCALEIKVPGLAERGDDIVPMARHFLKLATSRYGRKVTDMSAAASLALREHTWPGNVRELQVAVDRAVVLCAGSVVTPDDVFPALKRPSEEALLDIALDHQMTIEELNFAYARRAMHRSVGNRDHAAELLGVSRRALDLWLRSSAADVVNASGDRGTQVATKPAP